MNKHEMKEYLGKRDQHDLRGSCDKVLNPGTQTSEKQIEEAVRVHETVKG